MSPIRTTKVDGHTMQKSASRKTTKILHEVHDIMNTYHRQYTYCSVEVHIRINDIIRTCSAIDTVSQGQSLLRIS